MLIRAMLVVELELDPYPQLSQFCVPLGMINQIR